MMYLTWQTNVNRIVPSEREEAKTHPYTANGARHNFFLLMPIKFEADFVICRSTALCLGSKECRRSSPTLVVIMPYTRLYKVRKVLWKHQAACTIWPWQSAVLPPKECFNLLAECQCGFPCGISSLAETLRKLICPVTDQAPDAALAFLLLIWLNIETDYCANATIYLYQNRVVGSKCFQM